MKKILCIFLITQYAWHVAPCKAQVLEQWRAIYTGPGGGDFVRGMCIDSFGNVYVTGDSGNLINSFDFATVKYSSFGIQQWTARYSAFPNRGAMPYSITVDRFGNAYVTGCAPLSPNGPDKYTTIKYNKAGIQVWVKIYFGELYEAVNVPYSISTDYNANVYITGESWFFTSGYDYVTIKYDSSGAEQWIARYEKPGLDWGKKVVVDNTGNVYVTGVCFYDTTYDDIVTIKYNSSGIQQWAARYNGPGDSTDIPYDLKVDNYGNVYVTGTSWGGGITHFDYITIKYNQSGIQQWASRYTGTGYNWTRDEAYSLAVDNSGNVYITGHNVVTINQLDCATIKYDSLGIQQWVKLYDYSSSIDYGVALTLDKLGNIYVIANSYEGLDPHYATIKYLPSGTQEWVIRTYSPGGENPAAIAVDSSGSVYVTGSNGDYLTIKYNQVTGIKSLSNEIPDDFRLYQNYPNPFNPITKINFDISIMSRVELKVYDVIGKLVRAVYSGVLERGKYTLDFNASNIASGIYYYELMAESETGLFRDVKKMVVVK